MKTCKTCKYWSVIFDNGKNNPNDCDFIRCIQSDKSKSMRVEFETLDDSGLDIHFMTGPEFSCIHWKSK